MKICISFQYLRSLEDEAIKLLEEVKKYFLLRKGLWDFVEEYADLKRKKLYNNHMLSFLIAINKGLNYGVPLLMG